MKTLEFKLSISKSQAVRLDEWLKTMSWVHNSARACIEAFNNHNRYLKTDKRSYACNPIASYSPKVRGYAPSCPVKHQLDQFNPDQYAEALANPKDKKGTVYPLQAWEGEPIMLNLSYFSLLNRFAKKLHPTKLADVPQKFIAGRVERVALSWQAFLKGNAKPPKFKGRRDLVTSLINNGSKSVRIEGDRINVPRIGWLKAKGLSRRWPEGVPFCPMKIIKVADGWYLQLTGHVNEPKPVKTTGKVAGIDPGSVRHHTLDNGSFVEPPRYLVKSAKKLRKLQRKLSRQFHQNSTQIFDKNGRCCRVVFDEGWERKNFDKTKLEIAKLHQLVARQRKAFNHRLSSKYVRMFDAIALEDTKLQNMTRAVKTGTAGQQNGRKRKSGLNRNLLDNAIGQFYMMLETKAKVSGRQVVRVAPQYTSVTCNHCGYRGRKVETANGKYKNENRLSQSRFHCQHCGHKDNADRNAAKNIKSMMVLGINALKVDENSMTLGWREWDGVQAQDRPVLAKPKDTAVSPQDGSRTKPGKGLKRSKPKQKQVRTGVKQGSRKRKPEPPVQLGLTMVY